MPVRRLVLRVHAARRMLQRGIAMADVEFVLATGEEIERYPEDTPLPSRLVLGWPGGRPLHVVAADEPDIELTHVITAYYPDIERWEPGFRTRKP